MIAYKAVGFRPLSISPLRSRTIGQFTPAQAKGTWKGAFDAGATLLDASFGAGAAWVGFYTGSNASGLLSVLGYVVGVGGALRSALDVLGLVLMATGAGMQTATEKTPV